MRRRCRRRVVPWGPGRRRGQAEPRAGRERVVVHLTTGESDGGRRRWERGPWTAVGEFDGAFLRTAGFSGGGYCRAARAGSIDGRSDADSSARCKWGRGEERSASATPAAGGWAHAARRRGPRVGLAGWRADRDSGWLEGSSLPTQDYSARSRHLSMNHLDNFRHRHSCHGGSSSSQDRERDAGTNGPSQLSLMSCQALGQCGNTGWTAGGVEG